eukprot:c34754_g1_i1.p1 GENE.c34754_g1_i1~~c34754_g1_i1.p1  ORF type:complete len:145 (-),score=6.13 c34754_g1_i1:58-492(-)
MGYGSIASQVGMLDLLASFDIRTNFFFGPIPSHFGLLSKLTGLYLSSNKLTGNLPSQLGSLPLNQILINNNAFAGAIPNEVESKCAIINTPTYKNFKCNTFTGPTPSSKCMNSTTTTACSPATSCPVGSSPAALNTPPGQCAYP